MRDQPRLRLACPNSTFIHRGRQGCSYHQTRGYTAAGRVDVLYGSTRYAVGSWTLPIYEALRAGRTCRCRESVSEEGWSRTGCTTDRMSGRLRLRHEALGPNYPLWCRVRARAGRRAASPDHPETPAVGGLSLRLVPAEPSDPHRPLGAPLACRYRQLPACAQRTRDSGTSPSRWRRS